MTANRFFRHWFAHFVLLSILLLERVSNKESDMHSIIFLTLLYVPFLGLMTGSNMVLLFLGLANIKPQIMKWLSMFFFPVVLTVWYLVKAEHIVVHHWQVTASEFWALNLVFCLLNVVTVYRITLKWEKSVA